MVSDLKSGLEDDAEEFAESARVGAEKLVREVGSTLSNKGREIRTLVSQSASEIESDVQYAKKRVTGSWTKGVESLEGMIVKNPIRSVAGAFGAGLLVAGLMNLRRKA